MLAPGDVLVPLPGVPEPVPRELPGVGVPLVTPVAGGVVDGVTFPLGGQGTAVPLVPTLPGVEPVVPVVLCAVVPVVELGPDCCAAAAADGDPLWASGPASVALLVVPLLDVVVPVELFTRLCGSFAAAEPLCVAPATVPGVEAPEDGVPGVPVVLLAVPVAAPVTGTQGVVDTLPGCVVVVPLVPVGVRPLLCPVPPVVG